MHLQNRLRSLSSGLVGLRHTLHENGLSNNESGSAQPAAAALPPPPPPSQPNYCNVNGGSDDNSTGILAPAINGQPMTEGFQVGEFLSRAAKGGDDDDVLVFQPSPVVVLVAAAVCGRSFDYKLG